MEISEEQQIGKKYCSGKSIEWEKSMGISNSQSTERSLYNFVFPNWLDEIVCAAMLAYPHEQRICWSWVRKWTGKRFGERCAESWNLHAGTGRRNSLPATVGSCRSTKMQLAIGWIGGHPAMLIGRFASLRSGACHRKSVGWTLELCASQRRSLSHGSNWPGNWWRCLDLGGVFPGLTLDPAVWREQTFARLRRFARRSGYSSPIYLYRARADRFSTTFGAGNCVEWLKWRICYGNLS